MKQNANEDCDVLYEDNHLIAVVKSCNMATQPTPEGSPNLEEKVKAYIKTKYEKKGNVYLHAVHRLDKATSGIVLFAKTEKALSRMNELMRSNAIKKHYLAYCEGFLESGDNSCYLVHEEKWARVAKASDPNAKQCHLSWETLSHHNGNSILLVNLTTGRYHQIRAQLAHLGHPIVGDTKYGSGWELGSGFENLTMRKARFPHSTNLQREIPVLRQTPFPEGAIFLHHVQMQFVHPVTKIELNITCEPPSFWSHIHSSSWTPWIS